jgi:hypothetical protein
MTGPTAVSSLLDLQDQKRRLDNGSVSNARGKPPRFTRGVVDSSLTPLNPQVFEATQDEPIKVLRGLIRNQTQMRQALVQHFYRNTCLYTS